MHHTVGLSPAGLARPVVLEGSALPATPVGPQEVWGVGSVPGRAALALCKPALQPGGNIHVLPKLLLLEHLTVTAANGCCYTTPRGCVNPGAG